MDRNIVNLSPNPSTGPPTFGKTRRLSLDAVAAWRFLSSSTASAIVKKPPPVLDLSASVSRLASSQNDLLGASRRSSQGDVPNMGPGFMFTGVDTGSKARWSKRRSSQADIMMRASQVDKLQALQKKEKSGKSSSSSQPFLKGKKGQSKQPVNKESYLLVEMEDGEMVVLTCKDEHHMKTVLTAALMDRRVHSYRMVVASTRAVFKLDHGINRRVRSCEDLLDNVDNGGDRLTWSSQHDRRLMIAREFLEQEKHYCDNLQSLFDVYAEPLRKFSALTKEDHQIMFMPLEPLFSLSASLVTKLESVLESWDSRTGRIGNLFSSKFWNYYKEYYSEYFEAKKLFWDKFKTDSSFREFCELRRSQGRLSLDALLTLPSYVQASLRQWRKEDFLQELVFFKALYWLISATDHSCLKDL